MSPRPVVIVFVKEPQPGRVKTRLARDIGTVGAAWWFRHQATRLIRHLGRDPRFELWLAVSPDRAGLASRVWQPGIPRLAQGGGDLGRRMLRALNAAGPRPAAVIGSDVPGLEAAVVMAALQRLGGADTVLGPAPDGGFWLIARRAGLRLPEHLLDGVAWSTEHARAQTLARLSRHPGAARAALAGTLADVDTVADLRALRLPVPDAQQR
ncbi:MAG: TIGR04282 family arsenosugar biosynthesis glycosyltransferase [Pseudomonadota bacterium]